MERLCSVSVATISNSNIVTRTETKLNKLSLMGWSLLGFVTERTLDVFYVSIIVSMKMVCVVVEEKQNLCVCLMWG